MRCRRVPQRCAVLLLRLYREEAKNKEIVLFNPKSLKYHKLNCKNGLSSKNKKYFIKEDLPPKAKPCGYCYATDSVSKEISNLPLKNQICEKINSYGDIQVFIEHGAGVYKPSNCTSKICKALKTEIDNAKSTIDMAVYDLSNMPEIVDSLVRAEKRGVKIRVATDNDNLKNSSETVKNIEKFTKDIFYDSQPAKDANRLMHNKFFVFDNKKVWTGSANITNTGLSGFNANNALLINSEQIAKIYANEFENFANNKFHSAKKASKENNFSVNQAQISVFFSPQDKIITNQIIKEIQNAKQYIYIPIFIITDKQLASELVKAKQRGVDVKLIIDATSARNKYSQHTLFRQNNIPVKTENFAGKMHMKTVIIDDRVTFIGSMNLTKSGNVYNDENCLKIVDANITKDLKKEFMEIWSKIPDKYLHQDPPPESPESVGSCFDGVDNDYDGKIDNFDTGCHALYKK